MCKSQVNMAVMHGVFFADNDELFPQLTCHAIAENIADAIRIFVLSAESVVPIITATVNMPLADALDIGAQAES